MNIGEVFQNRAQHLFWRRLGSAQVVDAASGEAIERDEAYFVVRMKEMYLAATRRLWRKFYPVLHGYVEYAGSEAHAVAGPGQLRELAELNLDRMVNLNYRLTGPTAYQGGDVSLLIGLYSVPAQDAAKALIDTLSTVANLGGIALGQSVEIANVIKTGIENIVGLNEASLELGIRDTFYQNNPLQSGYYVGINAPATQVVFDQLWLREGRLVKGADPIVGMPYEDHDYMVLEIERRTSRDDWPGLPGLAEFQEKFAIVMRDSGLSMQQKRERLGALWPQFTQALSDSAYLTRPDREQIAASVAGDLNRRLQAMESGNPFESRSWKDERTATRPPAEFDFLDVPDYVDHSNPDSVRAAKAVLVGSPFAG
jgi:hypothetical protein